MNPLARLVVAVVVAVGLVSVKPGSVVAWVFGVAGFVVVMGGAPPSKRRRY